MSFTKRVVALVLGIVMAMGLCTLTYATDNKIEEEEWGYLFHGPLNIRIFAKVSDIMNFATASDETAREHALKELISNPLNKVNENESSPFERISSISTVEEVNVEIEATRTPGTWNITPFTIPGSSQGWSIGPSTSAAFDGSVE